MINLGKFKDMVQSRWDKRHFLCVGLDTDYEKLPRCCKTDSVSDALFAFNKAIVEATAEYCCAFKPNSAFYEGYGIAGMDALIRTNQFIKENYPEIPVILDAKRADIGSTNRGYVRAAFEIFQADAITVHPYLGQEALKPFLDNPDYGVIVLCHTSNPGAGEFQELKLNGTELYKEVAARVSRFWNTHGNCALVVGATYPEQLGEVRKIVGDMPILIPGIGAQGGDLEQTVINGLNGRKDGMMINASRSIIYASGGDDFTQAAAAEAARTDAAIREIIGRN